MSHLLKTKRVIWSAVFALVTAAALLSYFSGTRYVAAVSAVEHTLAVELAITRTLSLLKDAETGTRGYILTGDSRFLEPYDEAQRGIPAQFSRLKTVTSGEAKQGPELVKLESLMKQKFAFMDETIRLRRSGDFPGAAALVHGGLGKQLMDGIRGVCARMAEHEAQLLRQQKQQARAAQLTTLWGIGIGFAATVLLSFLSLLTVHRDVQHLERTAKQLAASEEHFRLLTEHSTDLVRLVDLQGKTKYVSPSVERLLGYTVDEFMSLPPLQLIHPTQLADARSFLTSVRNGSSLSGVETYQMRHKSGEFRWFEMRWAAWQVGDQKELHTAARDVTERKVAEEQLAVHAVELRSLSLRDELTGLYNRRGFLEVAAHLYQRAVSEGRRVGLIFVDLNGMKRINDEFGHDAGDTALVDAASVLRAAHHNDIDVLARLGGDEFVVLALDFTSGELQALRQRLRELCDLETARLGRPYRLSMSVGAAFTDPGSEKSLEQLVAEADGGMYEQKNARRIAGDVSVMPPAH